MSNEHLILRPGPGTEMMSPDAMNPRAIERYAGTPAQPAPPPSDWQRYMTSVARHKWLVMSLVVLGTAGGVFGTRYIHPRYAAKSVLYVRVDNNGRAPMAADPLTADVVQAPSWAELVKSNQVLDTVVRGMRLYIDPQVPADFVAFGSFEPREGMRPGQYRLTVDPQGSTFELAADNGDILQKGAVGDSVGAPIGFGWAPTPALLYAGRQIEFTIATPYEASRQLADALQTRLEPGSNLLHIELKGEDPARTAATVNAITNRVVTLAAELKVEKFQELAKILGEQNEHARAALASGEAALTDFHVKNVEALRQSSAAGSAIGSGAGGPGAAASIEMRLKLEELRRDRAAITAALSAGSGMVEALQAITSVHESKALSAALDRANAQNAEVRLASIRYTPEALPVRTAQATLDSLEKGTIPVLARGLIAELQTREQTLTPRVDSTFRDLQQVPTLALDEARLARRVASAEDLANIVGQRYEATRLALLSTLPDLRVLDPAVAPQTPVNNYGPLLVALSFMASLGLVVVGVTVKDKVDPRVRYADQVTRDMRLPILAAVPHVSWKGVPKPGDVSAEVIEALRGLRVRVIHAHGVEGPLLLTVTSPSVGEGKSFISANLALSFAYAGYKTLLIDGDLRRGAQHRVFGTMQGPGLTDILTGQATVAEAIQPTAYAGLSFMGSGTRMECAPELLLSPSLRQLMGGLRTEFGVVVVDSPPLVAGVDPLVLATVTGNLLLVLRSGVSDLPLTMAKLDVADSLPVRTIGAVLNDVKGKGAFREYAYDLSTYGQLEGVVAPPEKDTWRRILTGRSS